jgi:hypothetical protein
MDSWNNSSSMKKQWMHTYIYVCMYCLVHAIPEKGMWSVLHMLTIRVLAKVESLFVINDDTYLCTSMWCKMTVKYDTYLCTYVCTHAWHCLSAHMHTIEYKLHFYEDCKTAKFRVIHQWHTKGSGSNLTLLMLKRLMLYKSQIFVKLFVNFRRSSYAFLMDIIVM